MLNGISNITQDQVNIQNIQRAIVEGRKYVV